MLVLVVLAEAPQEVLQVEAAAVSVVGVRDLVLMVEVDLVLQLGRQSRLSLLVVLVLVVLVLAL